MLRLAQAKPTSTSENIVYETTTVSTTATDYISSSSRPSSSTPSTSATIIYATTTTSTTATTTKSISMTVYSSSNVTGSTTVTSVHSTTQIVTITPTPIYTSISTSTPTSSTTTMAASSASLTCLGDDGQIFEGRNYNSEIERDIDRRSNDLSNSSVNTFTKCLDMCDSNPACTGVS